LATKYKAKADDLILSNSRSFFMPITIGNSPQKPIALVLNGLPSYNEVYQKEFFTKRNPRTINIRSVSVRNEGLNSKVEGLHGSSRETEK
jgi:hypothetical protein